MRTWKVLDKDFIADGEPLPFDCLKCDQEALCPTHGHPGSPVIAIVCGMKIIFDQPGHVPPDDWLPHRIQCRKCRTIYLDTEGTEIDKQEQVEKLNVR
jgi:hypothetical protein